MSHLVLDGPEPLHDIELDDQTFWVTQSVADEAWHFVDVWAAKFGGFSAAMLAKTNFRPLHAYIRELVYTGDPRVLPDIVSVSKALQAN